MKRLVDQENPTVINVYGPSKDLYNICSNANNV